MNTIIEWFLVNEDAPVLVFKKSKKIISKNAPSEVIEKI